MPELLRSLSAICVTEGRSAADRTAAALLAGAPDDSFGLRPPTVFDIAIRSLLSKGGHPAAAAILSAQDCLPWVDNAIARPLSAEAADISTYATLLGPDGPIFAADLRLGLYYQRPDTYYALHNHDADETYAIICGEALWTSGEDVRMRGPGSMIHHPSLMPHAFRSGPEGFLALWRWSGDINLHSYAFLPDPMAGSV
ncbi:MAG: hypothetical protein KDE08_04650 [Rhodobacteraceae bacterium]|nr:hypothetical protein [Paracoccaceae bacterium]